MRASTFLIALGFIGTSFAAPTPLAQPQPQPVAPILFAKDPLAIHKRADVPDVPDTAAIEIDAEDQNKDVVEIEVQAEVASAAATASSSTSVESAVVVPLAESSAVSAVAEPSTESESEAEKEEPCVSICGVQRVEGAKSEREALCSVFGLQATLACAKCIDETWPETTWEDSAMAEYERIVSACDDSPQT
ncbi:hypothetical protein I316_05208 [Kwoniella heveanensis BCC8398]|uniref:Uncharacterized protein n=1 Tax=Kwoniella heveanensis BCC8398 TaxID=1296120 RepID=A0A1B9GQ76_9TREE|nr:hypothetical protein I316_05208 [Kwoniella heveanensis BCC8398]